MRKRLDNILDDVSLKWFNASEGEKYAWKRIIITFMATLEKWIEFLGRVKGSTSHGTNLTLVSENDIFCAIWHLVLSHVNFDAWTSPASNYGKPGETRDNAPCTRMWVSRLPQMESMLAGYLNRAFDEDPLSSAEAPAGYPNKNSNNRKIESARGTIGRGKRREPLPYNAFKMAPDFRGRLELGFFPLPIVSRPLSFPLYPALPTIQRGGGERRRSTYKHSYQARQYRTIKHLISLDKKLWDWTFPKWEN